MDEAAVIMGEKGKITLPKWVMDNLGVKPGDDIVFKKSGSKVLIEKC